jgi:Ni,Fe-hydrogenase I cytochrome b subunit
MELRNRSLLLIFGFLLFVIGMISLILTLVNVRLTIMNPIDDLGYLFAIPIKLIMVISGLIIVYIQQTNR